MVLAFWCGEGHWWIHVLAAVLGQSGSEVSGGGGSSPDRLVLHWGLELFAVAQHQCASQLFRCVCSQPHCSNTLAPLRLLGRLGSTKEPLCLLGRLGSTTEPVL